MSLTDAKSWRGKKKRQQDEMREDYIEQKGYLNVEMSEGEPWIRWKNDASVSIHRQ